MTITMDHKEFKSFLSSSNSVDKKEGQIGLGEYSSVIDQCTKFIVGRPPQLLGFVYAYHPAAPVYNPKHTIYAFFIYIVEIGTVFRILSTPSTLFQLMLLKMEWYLLSGWEKDENKRKRGRHWPIFKKSSLEDRTPISVN